MALQNFNHVFPQSLGGQSFLTRTLGEEFSLCENGNVIFHWADFHETCDLIKTQLENDPSLSEDFKHREKALSRLGLIPVWVRTENRIHQTTMYELYEKYILNQNQLLGGIDPFCPLQISFISGTGPFKDMSIAECFNQSIYRDFVLVYLLKGKLPRRDFRIRLKSKILLEYGTEYQNAELVALEQLTMNGLLLSLDSGKFMKEISNFQDVRVLINSKMLAEGFGKGLPELKEHLSKFAFNLLYSSSKEDAIPCSLKDINIQSSFDFSRNKKVFLFVSYAHLASKHPESIARIKEFVQQTRDLVRDHYKNVAQVRSA
jgi:hypothetical protein